MKKLILILGILVAAFTPFVSHAQNSIEAEETLLAVNRQNLVHFTFSDPSVSLDDVHIASRMPVKILNANTLSVIAPSVHEASYFETIHVVWDKQTFEFEFALKIPSQPDVVLTLEDGRHVGRGGLSADARTVGLAVISDRELTKQQPHLQQYRVREMRLTLADGVRPISSHLYTAEDLAADVIDLKKLYGEEYSPQAGERIVVEVIAMDQVISDNKIAAIDTRVPPRSIPLK
ncbi:MAG TPA: hypothetical protein DCE41_14800 [Cytophagales bacterium]|nr:hypothetical protein [Cytophagales bacterium]HAA17840.1 hypothetical protein [Cytophagales bacterium]HAP58238.1 hypothetical protein [Cytophagales bacterium]